MSLPETPSGAKISANSGWLYRWQGIEQGTDNTAAMVHQIPQPFVQLPLVQEYAAPVHVYQPNPES